MHNPCSTELPFCSASLGSDRSQVLMQSVPRVGQMPGWDGAEDRQSLALSGGASDAA